MWFRNLTVLRLAPGWRYSAAALRELLSRTPLVGCGASDRVARGWVPPRGIAGELVVTAGGYQLIALGVESKQLTAGVVRQYAAVKLGEIEAAQGYKPGKKQTREVREQVELELLARAFVARSQTHVLIDTTGRWLLIDTASNAVTDAVVEQLKITLGELPLTLLQTAVAPGTAMTQWVASEAPDHFTIDCDCALQSTTEVRAAVRYTRHNLDSDDVRGHIAAGKRVEQLALTWGDRISFVLTEQMRIKRLGFLDVLKEDAERQAGGGDDLVIANMMLVLMGGELSHLLGHLVAALGGERVKPTPIGVKARAIYLPSNTEVSGAGTASADLPGSAASDNRAP